LSSFEVRKYPIAIDNDKIQMVMTEKELDATQSIMVITLNESSTIAIKISKNLII